jgi:cytoskeletal protein RodZ
MTLELGTTSLSQARLARGLTLEDAERGTRISRRFLIALEEHNYGVFPAPVYARGFLRTYCRYLGVDPEQQLAELPAGWASSTPTTHLPPVSRGPMTFNMAWIIAGAVLAAIVGIGVFISQGSENLGELETEGQQQVQEQQQAEAQNSPAATTADTANQTPAQPTQTTQPLGRALEPGLPGILPDFQQVAVNDVTGFLTQQGIAYLRIDTTSDTTPAGLVISQTPAAGASTEGLAQVTLTVSAGPTIGAARTDCSVLESTNRRTAAEQTYYEQNCASPAAGTGDRTDCEEIRGTDYRSPAERTYFLANCVTQ